VHQERLKNEAKFNVLLTVNLDTIRVNKTNLMHYLFSVYTFNQPLHVSGIFVAHHQEVYCIYTTIGTCCIYTVYCIYIYNNWYVLHTQCTVYIQQLVRVVYTQYTS